MLPLPSRTRSHPARRRRAIRSDRRSCTCAVAGRVAKSAQERPPNLQLARPGRSKTALDAGSEVAPRVQISRPWKQAKSSTIGSCSSRRSAAAGCRPSSAPRICRTTRRTVVVKVPLPVFSSGIGSWSIFQREEEIGRQARPPLRPQVLAAVGAGAAAQLRGDRVRRRRDAAPALAPAAPLAGAGGAPRRQPDLRRRRRTCTSAGSSTTTSSPAT